jgi:cyanate permease
VLHDLTGGWDASIAMVAVLGLAIGVSGAVIARSGPLEDQLAARDHM